MLGVEDKVVQNYGLHSFLQTAGARERIPHFLQELQLAQQRLIEYVDDEQQPEYQDEWMVPCQRNPRFTVHSEQDDQVDWEAAARDFPREILRECPNWIISQRHLSEASSDSTWHRQLPAVEVITLNSKQKHAYDLIQDYHVRFLSAGTTHPLHMIVRNSWHWQIVLDQCHYALTERYLHTNWHHRNGQL